METIDENIRAEIIKRLHAAEAEHDIHIFYACESGSRAWGFSSPDSDYDVRFLYVRDMNWYLSFDVEKRRDVVEYPIVDEIDCGGWDIRKALHLLTRTNGALLEWLNSPIKYIETGPFAQQLRGIAPEVMNPIALCYHYSHMARGNAREYLFKDKVRLKKYFYVLRPLFAIRYIEQGLGIPPVEFEKLVASVAPRTLVPHIEQLLELKRKTVELGEGDAVPAINNFIEQELQRHGTAFTGLGRPEPIDKENALAKLNHIFQAAIRRDGKAAIQGFLV